MKGPHIRSERTTKEIMMHVSISLVPALLGGIYYFGMRALYLTAASVLSCIITEYLWQKWTKQKVTACDFSVVVTGMLLGLNMPVNAPLWVVIVASVFSILFVKEMFGGIGNNFVNPALMGRLLVMVVWPATIMKYAQPNTIKVDAISTATVLSNAKAGGQLEYTYWQMFVGEIPGAIGETGKIFLLIGFAYMCYQGIVNIEAALSYIGTVVALTFVFGPNGLFTGDIWMNLFSGGLIMGGCYMLTDYVFVSRKGRILYAVTAGVITAAIRLFSNYPDGVCFGILTANCLAGMLAVAYKKRVYGMEEK